MMQTPPWHGFVLTKGELDRMGRGGQLYPFSDLGSLSLPTSQGVGEASTEMVPQTQHPYQPLTGTALGEDYF